MIDKRRLNWAACENVDFVEYFMRVADELKREDGGAISASETSTQNFHLFLFFSAILARTNLVKRFEASRNASIFKWCLTSGDVLAAARRDVETVSKSPDIRRERR